MAETIVEKTGECEFTVTVKIVIAGPLGTPEQAAKMSKTFEDLWNGPQGEDASVFGSNLGMETRSLLKTDQGPESLPDDRKKIDAEYEKYLAEFGFDESCAYLDCCKIVFKADIRPLAEGEIWPKGRHYVEIVADETMVTETINGKDVQVPFRSYVNMHKTVENPDVENPDHWRGTGPGDDSFGKWTVGKEYAAEAHEMGHLMGLDDQYIEEGGSQPGHAHDLMTDVNGFPFEDGLLKVLTAWGMECDCCPDEKADRYWQIFGQTVLALGDSVQVCDRAAITNLLGDLQNQRRELRELSIAPSDIMQLASSLDAQIRKAEKALEDCPPKRPVTGGDGILDDVIFVPADAWALPGLDWASEGTAWCTYGGGVPEEGTPGDGDDPRDAPPPPEGTPEDGPEDNEENGDDPRDTPTPPSDGDDPRDTPPAPTPEGGDDPRDTPPPGDGFDPNDLPEIDLPGTEIIEEDDEDDPRDTPTSDGPDEEEDDDDDPRDVPVFVKAKTAVLDGAGAAEAVAGQMIKFFDSAVTEMALPTEGGTKVDTAYNEDPMQCTTDENGDCTIDVPEGVIKGAALGGDEGSDYRFDPKVPINELYGIEFDVTPTQGEIIKVDTRTQQAPDAVGEAIAELDDGDIEYTAELNVDPWKYYSYGSYDYSKIDWSLSLGGKYSYETQIDYCRDKQPGPPLGWEPVGYDEGDAVPNAIIRFDAQVQP